MLGRWTELRGETLRFRDAVYGSTLPHAVLDAAGANISILKSPTTLRLQDGTFYGWEGCHPAAGSCEGSCTRVWNYQQALPFLFPALERSMREADYRYNTNAAGGMSFRTSLPLGTCLSTERPCADGQFGNVMKLYRDWKLCGDTGWLAGLWPAVRQSIEYAWTPENPDRWDPDQTGVLWGRQHHTLDMELFGPNSWLTGFYLGALEAAAEMADALGEAEDATFYRSIFTRGRAWVNENLFNGRYFAQRIDLKDRAIIAEVRSRIYSAVTGLWETCSSGRDSGSRSRLVRQAAKLLRTDAEDIGLADRDESIEPVARQLGYGKSRLYSLFAREIGMAPNDYRQRIRIKRCCKQLITTADSVTAIGIAGGFHSSQYFSRVFKKYVGVTPSQYRELFRS